MPKLHDACQILAEEILGRLEAVPEPRRTDALTLALRGINADLASRHPEAPLVFQHLRLVLDELGAPLLPDNLYDTSAPTPTADEQLVSLTAFSIECSRQLFR